MRIVNLIEDTAGAGGCAFAHGLSFYIETAGHRALMDLGPSRATLENAAALGIDLRAVDTVVLSHGHYDHSGGIMPFAEINDRAAIYMQAGADGEYYADDGEQTGNGCAAENSCNGSLAGNRAAMQASRYRYIGIDRAIMGLPQVKLLRGDYVIDEELEVFTVKSRTHALPSTNARLLVKNAVKTGNGQGSPASLGASEASFTRDDFRHEHFLVVHEGSSNVLLSGCAHNGILSILDAYEEKYGVHPDAVISGFHLMKKSGYTADEVAEIREIAEELRRYRTKFYTCHCTGIEAYEVMRAIMGGQLTYVHSGDEICL